MRHPLVWLTAGICTALLLPALFMQGMFFDGVMYASLSKNYAAGIGTFWEPVCTKTFYAVCHEQPPLFFFLQGSFFKIFGESFLTERLYALTLALLCSFLLVRIMRVVELQKISWLPVLLWMVMPVTFWAFQNNVIEGTMSVFVLAALLHQLRALHQNQRPFLHLLAAGGWLLLAGITKGPQGMFLLAAPGFWWLFTKRSTLQAAVLQSFVLLIVPAVAALLFWLYEPAHTSFAAYFAQRFGNTFAGAHNTTASRFFILYELLLDVLPALGIAIIVWLLGRKTAAKQETTMRQIALFLLAAGLSGILPLMVTLEQRGFYLVTALPLLALSFSIFIAPAAQRVQEMLHSRSALRTTISAAGLLITAGALTATVLLCGSYKRDADKLRDLARVAVIVPQGSILSVSEPGNPDWALLHNAWRYHNISIATTEMPVQNWMLLEPGQEAPENYSKVECGLEKYVLWKKR
jgi:4-amino-4-deoxy-L-arabinose transferase-like glycosyltransferase